MISVVTPTYNRAHTLPRLFESILLQGEVQLEWVVVDDGSTDETAGLVEGFRTRTSKPIRYFHQPNSGRHIALNRGIREAAGSFIVLMDSDDWLARAALQSLLRHWDALSVEEKQSFGGVTGLCADMNGRTIGTAFPEDVWDSDFLSMRARAGVQGDKKEMIRADLLKAFPFPEVPGERRAATSLALNRIARTHKVRFVNEIVAYKEYEPGGMSANIDSIRMRSPVTSRQAYLEVLMPRRDLPLLYLIRSSINYVRYSMHARSRPSRIVQDAPRPLLLILALAPAAGLYLRDIYRESKRRSGSAPS